MQTHILHPSGNTGDRQDKIRTGVGTLLPFGEVIRGSANGNFLYL